MTSNLIPLFHAQSYQDAWADYQRMLNSEFIRWDYVILTASNEQQANGFRAQLEERKNAGFLPAFTHFAVLPDPEGRRVGSGGATLNVIRYIAEQEQTSDFSGLRILVIHSGGDSKRVPQYSALGKLFSPVPRELPNGRASTLFDEFMISMSGVAARIREGMLLLSGDVLLLFNPLQIDFSGDGAAAISFKEHVETGKNHGVFLRGLDGNVARCLQKQSVESLKSAGAVNAQECVDIDTGAVIFSATMIRSLFGLISTEGKTDPAKYAAFVNETVRLSLYADFLYPLGTEATLDAFYLEKPEGTFSESLREARTEVWKALRPYRMKLLRLAPSKFIHFGTTREIMQLMCNEIQEYSYLNWDQHVNSSITQENIAGYNSVLSANAKCGQNCYLEVSYVHQDAEIGENTLLSYVDIHDEKVPSNVLLHGLKQKDGRFVVRILGIKDNPKAVLEDGAMLFERNLTEWMQEKGIQHGDLWEGGDHSIWMAQLYPSCATIQEAVGAALNLYELLHGAGDWEAWYTAERKSLCSGFHDADPHALIAWDKRMHELVQMDRLAKKIRAGSSVEEVPKELQIRCLTPVQQQWLANRLQKADFSEAMRLYYYLGRMLQGGEGERLIAECFRLIQQTILNHSIEKLSENTQCRITREQHTVRLPLRVNWGGGWSDTPPYCNENGGTVLNAAILLNGEMPVEVTLTRLAEPKIIFDSRDMDTHGEFDVIEPLQHTGDPFDPFALQKAALLACGIIPAAGGSLKAILERLGGGFRMQTEVTGVPKGSGLGTSSILAAACVKALFEFMGIPHTEDDLCNQVLCMEQIMSTGGGWQDQVGGLSNGIKYITTLPGLNQQIRVQHIEVPRQAMQELRERFALIYTGQRRLARHLLRDVVGRYVGNHPESLYALNEIQRVAALMRFELERGNIDAFAKLLSYHWTLSQKVDAGSTNTLIDQIFNSIDDLVDGKMISGAGGGGFLQVIMKKGIQRNDLHMRLKKVFQDSDVDVWDCTLVE